MLLLPEDCIRHDNSYKVFVIGMHRTGTRSLNAALQQLGYNTIHYPNPTTEELTLKQLKMGPKRWEILSYCDGIADVVTIPFCTELKQLYPRAKFILTVRDKQSWLASVQKHFRVVENRRDTRCADRNAFDDYIVRAIYYQPPQTADDFSRAYDLHFRRHQHLADLVYNVRSGWGPLCGLLNVEQPPFPFPFVK